MTREIVDALRNPSQGANLPPFSDEATDDEPWPDPPEAPLTPDEQFDEIEEMYRRRAEEGLAPLIPDEPFGQLDLRDQPPPCFACRGTVYWTNTADMAICARCHPRQGAHA